MQLIGSELQVEFAICFFFGFRFCLLVVGKVQLVGSKRQMKFAIGAFYICLFLTRHSLCISCCAWCCLLVVSKVQLVGSELQVEFAICFFFGFCFCLLVVGKVQLVGSKLQVEFAIGAFSTCLCPTRHCFDIFICFRFGRLVVGKVQ